MKNISKLWQVLFLALVASHVAMAEESASPAVKVPDYNADTLSGDWGGARTELYKKGVEIGVTHKSDILSNVSGGTKRGTAWEGHTEFGVSVDFDKLAGWSDTSAYVLYQSDLGSKFNAGYVGSNAGVDNIEVGTNTALFYQAWLQKNFFKGSLSLLAGLYGVDSEFGVSDSSAVFINPVYGVNNEFALSGKSGPPVFPLGALAIRVKYVPTADWYAMAVVADGVPGDPNNKHGTHIKLGRGDGTLSMLELGYVPQMDNLPKDAEYFNKTAIGFWRYSTKVDDLDTSVTDKHRSQGVYFLAERSLYVEQGHPSQGLAGFVRLGFAPEKTQQVDWSSSVGLRYHGPFDGRDDDVLGVALTANHASKLYRQLNNSENYETDFELTYRAQIKSWLVLQPDVQYIVNPNMDLNLKDAWVFGVRTELNF